MTRYGMYQFQNATTFVVRDQATVFEPVVNGKGQPASALNASDVRFFALTHDEAKALKDKLNAEYHGK
jgi:hypothetical protein